MSGDTSNIGPVWCIFIGFIVKGQMNHDFAFGIEVNPCVIEITIGKPQADFQIHMGEVFQAGS